MKRVLFPALLFLGLYSPAQSLKKYPVSNTGCSVYMFCDPKRFTVDIDDADSSNVYTSECYNGEVKYGVMCIQLRIPITMSNAEQELIERLDFMKADFSVTDSAGYGRGLQLNNNPNTRGVLDYWKDSESNHWKIKAWTDGTFIAILYAVSKTELPEQKVNVFLEGIRFKE
ncbi:MAG TPA: hypothetical protein VHM26_06330 [Chitinophagaceae bacterium]|jgi:hypothetical protein|nr:hypothetical protein [Chitinophagaceae bacterium]